MNNERNGVLAADLSMSELPAGVWPEWIRVEDRLPEPWMQRDHDVATEEPPQYLVFTKADEFHVSEWCDGYFSAYSGHQLAVTHWRTLPPPPK